VAAMIGIEENQAFLWRVFSEVVKPYINVRLKGARSNDRVLYAFHESLVDASRPIFKEGVRSIVVVAPARTDYSREFIDHVRKHHVWLGQDKGSSAVVFGELVGSATTLSEVSDLVKTKEFCKLIGETTSGEADRIVDTLEERLSKVGNGATVLYSLKEIEELVYSQSRLDGPKPEYLVLTTEFLTNYRDRNRINRLLQISKNKNVKTRIINADTSAGKRLSQFGGLICFTRFS